MRKTKQKKTKLGQELIQGLQEAVDFLLRNTPCECVRGYKCRGCKVWKRWEALQASKVEKDEV